MKNLFSLKRILILSLLFFVIYSNAQFSFYTELRNARWESSVIDNNSNAVARSIIRLYLGVLGGSNGGVNIKETIMEDGFNYKAINTYLKGMTRCVFEFNDTDRGNNILSMTRNAFTKAMRVVGDIRGMI